MDRFDGHRLCHTVTWINDIPSKIKKQRLHMGDTQRVEEPCTRVYFATDHVVEEISVQEF